MAAALCGCAATPGFSPQGQPGGRPPGRPGERPNVILVMTDDQGYGDLGVHGNEKIRTPRLDRLAGESVELTRFYVCPVCSPTRASLMTGRYNYRTGVVDTYLGRSMMHPDEVTLAERLREGGYRTGIFGKWHLGDNYPLRSCDQGFDVSLVHKGGGIGQPADPPGNRYFDPILSFNGKEVRRKGYCTDIFFNEAIRFIEANRDCPFFAYIPTNAPHRPLQVAEDLAAPYRAMGLDDATARVYAMIANIDENVGSLLDRLQVLGLDRNTLLVFLTDNGPAGKRYNAGLRGRKGTVYEGGIRVPCFVRWPGRLEAGRRVDRIAAHIDVLPTVLDACGISRAAAPAIDGESLLPLLEFEGGDRPDRTLFFQWHRGDAPESFRNCAAVTDRYKLVDGKELYDLKDDPGERKDLASRRPEVVKRMRRDCETWFEDVSSTRGYAPPRIVLGSSFENPSILTRQDWRGPRAGWGGNSLGYWEVRVDRTALYKVTLRFDELERDAAVRFRLGGTSLSRPAKRGQASSIFGPVRLPAGPGRLEAWLEGQGRTAGVNYVEVERE